MANSKALDKLVSKTLASNNGELRRRKIGRTEKRLRKQQRAEIREEKLKNDQKPLKPRKAAKKQPTAEETEIENLKNEIVKELGTSDPYVKRQFRATVPTWEGLTPGLAPLGYDPDESDEDPY